MMTDAAVAEKKISHTF